MTDPTADAIAALEPFAREADKRVAPTASIKHLPDEWPIGGSALTYGDLRRAREVRSALLSAQGQAGKPVAWRIPNGSRHWIYLDDPDEAAVSESEGVPTQALFVQPQPVAGVTAALTTARTALEAAERNVMLLRNRLAPGLDETSANLILDDLNDALRATSPAEKDDGHGRG